MNYIHCIILDQVLFFFFFKTDHPLPPSFNLLWCCTVKLLSHLVALYSIYQASSPASSLIMWPHVSCVEDMPVFIDLRCDVCSCAWC